MPCIGNQKLHKLTKNNNRWYNLRVDLEDWDSDTRHAEYSKFKIEGGGGQKYKMTFEEFVGGDAGI